MVTVNQIEKGLASYVDTELASLLPDNTIQKVIAGTAISLMIRKSGSSIETLRQNQFVQMMDIFDEDGKIDIDTLAEELKKNIPQKGVKVELPMLGTLTIKAEDIDKLHEHICAY